MVDQQAAYLTTTQAAKRIGVSSAYVIRLFDQGVLEGIVLPGGGHRRVLAAGVDAFIKSIRVGGVNNGKA